VAALRPAESQLFANAVRGRHIDVARTDAAVRDRDTPWTVDYFHRNRMAIAAATARTPDEKERTGWIEVVTTLLSESAWDEIWMPLGAPHADHQLAVNACIAACVESPSLVAGRILKLYQDVPYAVRTPQFTAQMLAALDRAGVALEPESVPIGGVFEQKLRLVSLYASQFKIGPMREDIEASARSDEALVERLWTVRALPVQLHVDEIRVLSDDEEAQQRNSERWLAKNGGATRVRILLLVPTGRWKTDLSQLRQAFPRAKFDVYATPAALEEVSETPSDSLVVTKVDGGARAWAMLALRLVVSKRMPTLFHAGQGRIAIAKWLSVMWPLSDTLVVPSMNPVMRAIRRNAHPRNRTANQDSPE
jgi:hypothetical protein